MNRMLFVLLPLILLLTACSPALAEAPLDPSATSSPTVAASSTPTFFPTPTQTPTTTATPTFTPTPTPITLPVTNGTPIPDLPYEVITTENVSRLRQIARYGYPRLLGWKPTDSHRLTADGKTIAVGTTAGVEFYDAVSHQKTGGFAVEFLSGFDLTPDGRFVLTQAGDALTVWTREGEPIRHFDLEVGEKWYFNAVALSPDGAFLAVQRQRGTDNWEEPDKVDVYRVSDGSLLDTVRGNGALFSPDGKYLATMFGGSVYLYPVAELGEGWEKRLPKQSLPWCSGINEGCSLTFSPDGSSAALIHAGRVEVYRVEERRLVRQVSGWEVQDAYSLPSVQFSRDGSRVLIVTAPLYDAPFHVKQPSRAILVDVAGGEWLSKEDAPEGFVYTDGKEVTGFAWKAEGAIPSDYFLEPLLQVDESGNVIIATSEEYCETVSCRKLAADEVIGLRNRRIGISRLEQSETHVFLPGEQKAIPVSKENLWSIRFYDDIWFVQYLTAFSGWGTVYREDGRRIQVDKLPFSALYDGHWLVVNTHYDGWSYPLIVDVDNWTLRKAFKNPQDFNDVVAVKDGMIVSPYMGRDVQGGRLAIVFSAGKKLIEIPAWEQQGYAPLIRSGAFSPDAGPDAGLLAIDGGNGWMYLVDLSESTVAGQLRAHQGVISAIAFSPDGRFIATSGEDGFIRVWAVVPEDAPVK